MAETRRADHIRIGVLSDDVSNGYSEPIVAELSDAARERGAALVSFVEWLDPSALAGTGRRLTTDLAGPSSVDAILLLPIGYDLGPEDLARYCERFAPLPVCSVPDISGARYSRVSVDNEPGMREGVRHLVETHGYRKVAFVRGPERSDEAALRRRVYREVLEAHGITPDPAWEAPGNYVTQDGIDAVRLFFDERRLELDAIVCANDGMALGVLEALTARGIGVPNDVAVIGFDDVDLARYLDPPLTTVRQPLRELGRAALDLLIRQLEPGAPPERTVLSSELVIRESCGCLSYRQESARVSNAPPSWGVDALNRAKPEISRAMTALGIPGAPSGFWAESLYTAFVAEVGGETGAFRNELRTVLNAVGRVRGDVGGFHKVLTLLWQRSRKCLQPGSLEWHRADLVLHAARAATSGSAERVQAGRQVRFEDFSYKLTRTGNALSMAVDLTSVGGVLAADLPEYGIDACYVCLYDDPPSAEGDARLVAGFGPGGSLALSAEGLPFPSERLVPDAVPLFADGSQYVVGPLSRSGQAPGYAVFARGPLEGFVYENLLAQIGAAVRRIDLVARLLEEARRREAAERRRLEEELALATRIQTGILPKKIAVDGLDVSAVMLPASEVGGDYYDVIPTARGCWLGIGDVAGHGLPTGLVMLMLQSAVSSLVHTEPEASPSDLLCAVNAVLYENIRRRMAQDEHVTLTLLRYEGTAPDGGGRLTFAGAHEDILIHRAAERRVEIVPTPGTWVGATRDIRHATNDGSAELHPGDVVLLYTDGVTEARNAAGEPFGVDRLAARMASLAAEPVEAIRDALLTEIRGWTTAQDDDVTLLVARQRTAAT
jgi:sigma-B regulation protein RsbU (phosphoserine phosphatase)